MTQGISGRTPGASRKVSVVLAMTAVLALSACDESRNFAFPGFGNRAGDDTTITAAQSVQLVERDVEAPDAFQVTQAGLWDGRPSLGGVWVAHPDVTEPERVIIRNLSNGTFVIGALFRREDDTSGPSLQVSSDAADALGMLAGSPTQLQVTALRREDVTQTPQAMPTADFQTPRNLQAPHIESGPIAAPMPAPVATAMDATPVAAPRPVSAPAVSGLAKPFIQIGIFSVEDNARGTADRMRSTGIVPTVLDQSSQGRRFWRVIVGPVTSESDRAEVLRQVKAQGFEDAYFVTN